MLNRNRRNVCTGFIHMVILLLAACLFVATPVSAENNITTIYHVYLDDQRIGEVDQKELIEKALEKKMAKIRDTLNVSVELSPRNLSVIPEQVFDPLVNNEQTIQDFIDQVEIIANAFAISIDGKIVAYLESEEEAHESTKQVKLKYIDEKTLIEYEKQPNDISDKKLEIGESVLTDIQLDGDFSIIETEVDPEKIVSVEEASEILATGKNEEKVYKVKRGDMLSVIAKNYGLSLEEILVLNPKIAAPSQIEIGQDIIVQMYQPYVSVLTEEEEVQAEEIMYDYEVIADSSMYKGDQEIIQQGQNGEKLIRYVIKSKDGQVVDKSIKEEKIVKSPIKHIVKKGTKEITSRSTGQFVWPTVGGYISSKMGYRNGRPHKGIDIARPDDRAILAADYGEVISAGWDGGYGNKIVVSHGNGLTTVYAHLSSINVDVGQSVSKGETIGVMGTTGNSTGIHLHFEVLQDGTVQDPLNYVR